MARLDKLHLEPNPTIDTGAPTSTGGMDEVTHLSDVLGLTLTLDPLREQYLHGWGTGCNGEKRALCAWSLTVQDYNKHRPTLNFDILEESSVLIIALHILKQSNFGQYHKIWKPDTSCDT